MSLIDGFVLLIKQHIEVFYLCVEKALMDRSYYSEQVDIKFVFFGLVDSSLLQFEVGSIFSLYLFFCSSSSFGSNWKRARSRTGMDAGKRGDRVDDTVRES